MCNIWLSQYRRKSWDLFSPGILSLVTLYHISIHHMPALTFWIYNWVIKTMTSQLFSFSSLFGTFKADNTWFHPQESSIIIVIIIIVTIVAWLRHPFYPHELWIREASWISLHCVASIDSPSGASRSDSKFLFSWSAKIKRTRSNNGNSCLYKISLLPRSLIPYERNTYQKDKAAKLLASVLSSASNMQKIARFYKKC